MKTRFRVTTLVALMAVAACDEAATEPRADDSVLDDDVAMLAADVAQEDLEVMNSMLPSGIVGAPAASTVSDFSRHRTVEFFDTLGAEQDHYDRLATGSIHTVLEVAGEMSKEGFEWSLDRSRDMWVTGLGGEETERTWNGTGAEDRSRARVLDNDAARTYDFTGTLLIEDVVRGVPRDENPWPLSGTITRNVTIEVTNGPNGDETITRLVVITFNGTQFVTMMVNDVEYDVDLAERGRHRIHRRHRNGG